MPPEDGKPPELQEKYRVSDEYWARVEPLIPPLPPKKKMGRPRFSDRAAFQAIYYVLRTGIQWNALPRSLGASTTVYNRFRDWRDAGLFEALWVEALLEIDRVKGLDLKWQSMDGVLTKAPLGGEKNRAKPNRPGQEGHEAESPRRRDRPTHRGRRGPRKQE
jgi:putative transposase